MYVSLFTDSLMHRTPSGIPFPVRDQFIHFISPLGKLIGHLEIVSKCKTIDTCPHDYTPVPTDESLSFTGLPFSSCTEDFFKRLPLIIPRALPAIKKSVSRSDLVILRIHNSLSWFVARQARKQGRPLVLYWAGGPIFDSVRANYPGNSPNQILARVVARFEDRVAFRILSKAAHNFIIDINTYNQLGSPRNASWVVPNLISADNIVSSPRSRNRQSLNLVFAGRLFRLKGIFDLIEAVDILDKDGIPIKLNIAGDGPESENLQKLIKDRRLEDRVRIEGNLTSQLVQKLMISCDVHVLPSYAEGLPKVLWEGWASGLATIISDVGSIGLYVKEGRNGLLIKPGNITELVSALKNVAQNEDLRYSLAEQGIKTAKEYTRDHELAKMASVLKDIVN